MKKTFTLIATIMLISSVSVAKIWRVNNTPNVSADFSDFPAALTAAAAGDTIYMEGSGTPYTGDIIRKRVIIIGPGYFLSENNYTQVNNNPARFRTTINFSTGAENSIIEGLAFDARTQGQLNNSLININCDNIIVRKNIFTYGNTTTYPEYYVYGIIISSGSNIIIQQNYGCYIDINSVLSSGILIQNNYLTYSDAYGANTSSYSPLDITTTSNTSSNVIVKNNIFRRDKIGLGSSTNFSNNILYEGFLENNFNALVANNIASGTQFGTANGNLANISMATVFEGLNPWDTFWKLKAGSPAIGAGYGSTAQNPIDCGIFSGSNPYVLSGLPPIPYIYSFTNQPIGSNSDPIDVTIKVKSNN